MLHKAHITRKGSIKNAKHCLISITHVHTKVPVGDIKFLKHYYNIPADSNGNARELHRIISALSNTFL